MKRFIIWTIIILAISGYGFWIWIFDRSVAINDITKLAAVNINTAQGLVHIPEYNLLISFKPLMDFLFYFGLWLLFVFCGIVSKLEK